MTEVKEVATPPTGEAVKPVAEVQTEVKNEQPAEQKPEAKGETPAEGEKAQQTIAEVLEPEAKVEKPKAPETVGLDKYLKEKDKRKALENELAELRQKHQDGATDKEVSDDINEIAEEYDIDPKFLTGIVKAVETRVRSEYDEKLKPLTEEKERTRQATAFQTSFETALANVPEYKNVVDMETIRQLSMLRDSSGKLVNGTKTIEQLIEQTYANALGGKRTFETTTPRGGQEPAEIDFAKAQKNTEYFKEIMANPTLKRKYNEGLEKRLKL